MQEGDPVSLSSEMKICRVEKYHHYANPLLIGSNIIIVKTHILTMSYIYHVVFDIFFLECLSEE